MSSLKDLTFEQLCDELKKRGFTVNVTNGCGCSGVNAAEIKAVEEVRVFTALEVIEKWCAMDRHRNDVDRKTTAVWTYFRAFDWARKPKGYSTDANKSVRVGLGEYSKYEDPASSQIVIIQHYDSERPGNYAKKNSWGDVPPVWGVAFSAAEMRELTKDVIANARTKGTLIHREPQGDIEPDEPCFNETHWLIENDKITGVKINIKCTQDKVANSQIVRFKMRGDTFELVGVESIDNNNVASSNANIALPTPRPDIVPDTSYLLPKTVDHDFVVVDAESGDNKTEGGSALQIRASAGKSEASNWDNRVNSTICQSIQTPTLTVTNPTDTRIAITEYWVELMNDKGEWERGESRVGVPGYRYGVDWVDTQSFEIHSHQSLDLIFQGTMARPSNGLKAYNGAPHNRRIHTLFPDPMKGKVSIKDDAGNVKVFYFEHKNEPLEDIWTSYDDAVAKSSKSDGFGPDFQAEMWLCMENPLTLDKCIICVTTAKTNPHDWYVRVSNDRRNVGGSYKSGTPLYFRKLAFKASLNAEKPAEIDVDLGSNGNCKLTGLVDYNTNTIYALHGVITIEDSNKNVIGMTEAYMNLDYARVTQKK